MMLKSITSRVALLGLCFSCVETDTNRVIPVDLDNEVDTVYYSSFVKELDYLTLDMRDSCLISDISKIFVDGDTILVQDARGAGVFVFTGSGDFVKQINYRGNGPEEFVRMSSFAVDPLLNQVCVYDMSSLKIVKYTYQGDFVKSYRTDNVYIRDFAVMPEEDNLFILPFYDSQQTSGVWLADTVGVTKKILRGDMPKDEVFEYTGNYYNRTAEGIYYYDRNRDDFSYVTADTLVKLFQFDLKQKVPRSIRVKTDYGMEELIGYSMMSSFANARNYLLISYYIFGDRPYYQWKWVFLDKQKRGVVCSEHLKNDMDGIDSESKQLFYLNDSTWCRLLDMEVDDCNLHLQILHLKEYFAGRP
jgi:hypothetical protein